MSLKNKPTITAFITRKDNNRNGLEITEIEFLLSQDRLILQEKHLCLLNRSFDGSTFPIHAAAVIGCIFRHCRNALVTNSAVSALYPSALCGRR